MAVLGSQYVPYPLTCVVSCIVNISLRSVTLITVDVPTLIHHNHRKPIVCISIQGLCMIKNKFTLDYLVNCKVSLKLHLHFSHYTTQMISIFWFLSLFFWSVMCKKKQQQKEC